METIPEEHKVTIRKLVAADPEVARATCDIPHFPLILLAKRNNVREENDIPYCGCFIGVYAWMQECKHGKEAPVFFKAYHTIYERTKISRANTSYLATWCNTVERDAAAVEYAMELLGN